MSNQIFVLVDQAQPISVQLSQMMFECGFYCKVYYPVEALAKTPIPMWYPNESALVYVPPGVEDLTGKFMYYAKYMPFSGRTVANAIADKTLLMGRPSLLFVLENSTIVEMTHK